MKDRYHQQLLIRARKMRKNPTVEERKLWKCLRKRQLGGRHFRRQHVLMPFIVDFYCAAEKLVLEVDGDSHSERLQLDQQRDEYLRSHYQVHIVRIPARGILQNFECVMAEIRAVLD